MSNLAPGVSFGRGIFEGSTPTDGRYQDYLLQRGEHIHHNEFKVIGGRRGACKPKSASATNQIRLCGVCHRATQGFVSIAYISLVDSPAVFARSAPPAISALVAQAVLLTISYRVASHRCGLVILFLNRS